MTTIEQICNRYGLPLKAIGDVGDISDGYHTFNDLYEQRLVLFAALCNTFSTLAWKSRKHSDGEACFDGEWFIVGIDTPQGAYTYHYKNEFWDLFNCEELEVAKEWDGHTDKDVGRLLSLEPTNKCCWISVDERLPKKPDYDWVLVRTLLAPDGNPGVPHIAELRNGVWFTDCCEGPMEKTLNLTVVAWFDMHLIEGEYTNAQ